MIPRVNLTKGAFLPLTQCVKTPQGQLFSDSFYGSNNHSQDYIPSKLKLELMKLFPTMFDHRVLELDNVNVINEIDSPQLQINLTLRCPSIENKQNYNFIKQQNMYTTQPIFIPKLSLHETISLCDMDKVFVSQLVRCPGVHLNVSPSVVSVVIISDSGELEISSDCETCSLTINGLGAEESDRFLTLDAISSDLAFHET